MAVPELSLTEQHIVLLSPPGSTREIATAVGLDEQPSTGTSHVPTASSSGSPRSNDGSTERSTEGSADVVASARDASVAGRAKFNEERRAAHVDGADGPAAAPRYGLRAKKASWPWRQTPARQAGTRRSVQ